MREIKFRAWVESEKKFIYFTLEEALKRKLICGGCFVDKALKSNKTQYTGLKDKNGREIYEGDIVEVYGHKDLIVGYGNHAYDTRDLLVGGLHREVCGFYIESKCGSWQCNISVILDELKVIGNIYEGDSK